MPFVILASGVPGGGGVGAFAVASAGGGAAAFRSAGRDARSAHPASTSAHVPTTIHRSNRCIRPPVVAGDKAATTPAGSRVVKVRVPWYRLARDRGRTLPRDLRR